MYEIKLQTTSLAALLCVLAITAAPSAQAQGMRIVRDPVTGQLRAPTADEAAAMDAQDAKDRAAKAATVPSGSSDSPAPLKMLQSNGVRYRVGDTFLSYSVVKRSADGTLDMQCVPGKEAAERLVLDTKASMPTTASTAGKEHDHAHE